MSKVEGVSLSVSTTSLSVLNGDTQHSAATFHPLESPHGEPVVKKEEPVTPGGVQTNDGQVNGMNGTNGLNASQEVSESIEGNVEVKPGPSRRTTLLSVEEVIAERWRRSQFKKRTAEEAEITIQTAARSALTVFVSFVTRET